MTISLQRLVVLLTILLGCGGQSAPELPPLPPKVAAPAPAATGDAVPLRELVLAVTADVRAEIEPCGCPTVPYGGLPRRERFLASLRAEGAPTFTLDLGNMLVKGEGRDPGQDERARLVLRLAREAGLDAWAPSPLDLVPGGPELLQGAGALSANWRRAGAPLLPGATILERGGVRLGVVGLSSGGGRDLSLAEAVGAVAAEVRPGAADAWVVLSNLSLLTNREVAERVPGVALVLAGPGETHEPPVATAGAPIVEVPELGRFVSVVRLYVGATPGPATVEEGSPWVAYGREVSRVRSLAAGPPRDAAEASLAERRAAVEAATAGRIVATVEHRPLGSELDGSSPLLAAVEAFKGATVRAAEARTEPTRGDPVYTTAGSCAGCHRRHFAQWLGDPHKDAWQALAARKEGENAECVPCHTTGFGEPGGFGKLTVANLGNWQGVQCAACHGPMSGHPDGVHSRPVDAATCKRCHDEANSPDFDVRTYRPRISCAVLAAEAP